MPGGYLPSWGHSRLTSLPRCSEFNRGTPAQRSKNDTSAERDRVVLLRAIVGYSQAQQDVLPRRSDKRLIEAGIAVAWFTLEQIGVLVRAHHADDSLGKAAAKIVRADRLGMSH